MTLNEKAIRDNFDKYVSLYKKQFNELPTSSFSYFRWLAQSGHGYFTANEMNIAQEMFDNLNQ